MGWLFSSERGATDRLLPRWLFLRALGVIYFSAFLALVFQIRGLIGPEGILPAREYLEAVASSAGHLKYWYAPTLLWFNSSSPMLMALCWVGLIASMLLIFNIWPRGMLAFCFVCFLSFVSAASDFSGYQSDGMLLEAGFISLFLAPSGWRPGLGREHPPMRASVFLLLWEWFRIYFESGVAKIISGDPEWRHFTAMDEYYQNGPLPTWIGWYVQHLPHWFHAATAFGTLALELALVWMLFLPRRWRIICFFVVTPWQIGVILTANYAFLNYLVLALGIFLLDDRIIAQFLPSRWEALVPVEASSTPIAEKADPPKQTAQGGRQVKLAGMAVTAVILTWLFYASTVQMLWMLWRDLPLPVSPIVALEPFRVAERYGLFAVMTPARYEIEFQGTDDGQHWLAYPFRFKPEDPSKAPGIYAPYQPRFDWNLWFASLTDWQQANIVPLTEERLLQGDADVLALFRGNPFPNTPPRYVKAVLWQYRFTSMQEKHETGNWWHRQLLGLYAPVLTRAPNGKYDVVQWPEQLPPHG
jgi:hypothetical protein